MEVVTIHAAKTTLSQLVGRAEAGEEVVISRGKETVAKLVPFHPVLHKRQFGAMRGQISVGPEFFEPLPEQELAAWE